MDCQDLDFGFSIETDVWSVTGGTPGWLAPEAESDPRRPYDMLLADAFAYGLLMWSVFLLRGDPPARPSGQEAYHAIIDLTESRIATNNEHSQIFRDLRESVIKLTQHQPADRPRTLQDLPIFADLNTIVDDDNNDDDGGEGSTSDSVDSDQESYVFSWEPIPISSKLDGMMFMRFRDSQQTSDSISIEHLFHMFLASTLPPHFGASQEDSVLALLWACAERGYPPAEALVAKFFTYYKVQLPDSIRDNICDYLQDAVMTGSVQARRELQDRGDTTLSKSLDFFRKDGGFSRRYTEVSRLHKPDSQRHTEQENNETKYQYNMLHWLSAYGDRDELHQFLQSAPREEIDLRTAHGETPLQIAFMRGDSEIAKELIYFGADLTINHERWATSCLHWIFNFNYDEQAEITNILLEKGIQLDCISSSIPFYHSPFSLPRGSSLHWAVQLECHGTIDILLRNGADPLLRNGADPYRYDNRVRVLNEFSPLSEVVYSLPGIPCQGLTPLDLAAMQRDVYVFEWLTQNKWLRIDINSADEMGFTVVHRLSADPSRWTPRLVPFDCRPFRCPDVQGTITHLLQVLRAVGADFQALTLPCKPVGIDYSRLMLAVSRFDVELTLALLQCNVNVNQENSLKETAIMFLGEVDEIEQDQAIACAKMLVTYGANINHRSAHGHSALRRVAGGRQLKLINYLLTQGADIAQRMANLSIDDHDSSVLSMLAVSDVNQSYSYDKGVAAILSQHLFKSVDTRLDDVIRRGNTNGQTLLHLFAEYGLVQCVELSIRYGVDINAERKKITIGHEKGCQTTTLQRMTPLDDALAKFAERRANMYKYALYQASQYEAKVKQYEEVIQLLRKHGAIELDSAATESHEAEMSRMQLDSDELEMQDTGDDDS